MDEAKRLHASGSIGASGESAVYTELLWALALGGYQRAVRILTSNGPDLLYKRDWFYSPGCDPFFFAIRDSAAVAAQLKQLAVRPCTGRPVWPIAPRGK